MNAEEEREWQERERVADSFFDAAKSRQPVTHSSLNAELDKAEAKLKELEAQVAKL